MKITAYTLATDTQENDYQLQAFATEAERDAAAWAMISELFEEGDFPESERPNPDEDDLFEVWDWVRADDLDSLWMEDCEIELPAPDGVNAGLLATLRKANTDLEAILDREDVHVPQVVGSLITDIQADLNDAIAAAEAGQVETTKPVRIGIVVDGGMIQEVFADGPAPQVYVIDYDVDDDEADDIMDVPQGGDKTAPACINVWTPDASNAEAVETLDAIDAWNQSSPELSPLKAVLKRQAAEKDASFGGKGGVS